MHSFLIVNRFDSSIDELITKRKAITEENRGWEQIVEEGG